MTCVILNHTGAEITSPDEDGLERVRSFSRGSYQNSLRYVNA